MLVQIITHTPTWVFGLFALLLWLGGRQLRAGQVSLVRMAIMPVAMAGLSVYGVWSAFGDSPLAALAWALALLAVCTLALLLAPASRARYHPDSRSARATKPPLKAPYRALTGRATAASCARPGCITRATPMAYLVQKMPIISARGSALPGMLKLRLSGW